MVKEQKKIKLPRKRKKAYCKVRGNKNYRGMIKFLAMEGETKFPKDIVSRFDKNGLPEFKALNYW